MADQSVNKYVIRQSMKALQEQRTFDSLEELAAAIATDLFNEGFSVEAEEKAKIKQIVDEEGYTGRFALDDLIRRKLKNKKMIPVVSVLMAGLAFLVTTTVAALIEHYVQKPLDDGRSAPLTAVFQVPEKAASQLHFRVQLNNISNKPLQNVVLFASAAQVAKQFPIAELAKGDSKTITGSLDLSGLAASEVEFVAYVIAGDFSLRSQPTTIARSGMELAMNESRQRAPEAAPLAEMDSAPPQAASEGTGLVAAVPARTKQARPESAARASKPSASSENRLVQVEEPVFRTVGSEVLDTAAEKERLRQRSDTSSQALLKAYGN